jgi:O-antigen/teichoic acid export membrane protein
MDEPLPANQAYSLSFRRKRNKTSDMAFGRSLYFSSLSSLVKVVVQFGLSIFVARLLTPVEIGSFGVALAAAALVRAFESAGISNFIASHKELTPELMRTVFTVNLALNWVLAALLFLLSEPLGVFFSSEAVATIMQMVALATALNSHMALIQGTLRRGMRFKELMWLDFFFLTIGATTTISAVLAGFGAFSLALSLIVENLLAAVIGVVAFRRSIPLKPRWADKEVVLGYGLSLSTATVIGIIGGHASNFILGRTLGLGQAAQFDRANTLPRLIWQIVFPSFHSVLVPEYARRHRDDEDPIRLLNDTVRTYAMLVWPPGLVLALLAPEVIYLLYGEQWTAAGDISAFLIFYGLLNSPIILANAALIALGRGGALINVQLAENGLKILVLLSAPFVGLFGLAALMAVPVAASAITSLYYLSRYELVSVPAFFRALTGPGGLSLLCGIPAVVALLVTEGGDRLSILQMVPVAVASTLIYCAYIWWREPKLRAYLLALLRPGPASDKP